MKKLTIAVSLIAIAALSGCADISYTRTALDGTRTTARAGSFFSNTALKGFNADSSTEKTRTGLKFIASDTSPDDAALAAVVTAAIAGFKAGKQQQ